jgi:hypothetical protein
MVATYVELIFQKQPDVADGFLEAVAGALLNERDAEFLVKMFQPELRVALAEKGIEVSALDGLGLGQKAISTLLKMLYAFIWQVCY